MESGVRVYETNLTPMDMAIDEETTLTHWCPKLMVVEHTYPDGIVFVERLCDCPKVDMLECLA